MFNFCFGGIQNLPYHYEDIPDINARPFWPLGRHVWRIFKELGFDYAGDAISNLDKILYDELNSRLSQTILTCQQVQSGKIPPENAAKTLTYMLLPPITSMRTDLSQGTMKLLYGDSVDLTFVVINDQTDEIFFLLNGHCETGVPVDWWVVGPDDDLLERRHLKLGFKLRDIYKRLKDFTKCGFRAIDILKDVRNERTPQFAHSTYLCGIIWSSGMAQQLMERSNWETWASIHDGVNAKSHYKLPDYWFCYIPWPQMVRTLLMLSRPRFTSKIVGMTNEHRLYIQPIEDIGANFLKDNYPELWEIGVTKNLKELGIPLPAMTLECQPPNFQDKKIFKTEEFDFNYPRNDFILDKHLGMEESEILQGVFLNVNHETPFKEDYRDDILSIGLGTETKFPT